MSNYAPVNYQVLAGNYAVRNFEFRKGDSLVYNSGVSINIINTNPNDGILTIAGELSGLYGTIEVILEEDFIAKDDQIDSVEMFNQVFGAGSLVSADSPEPEPSPLRLAVDHSAIYEQSSFPDTTTITVQGVAHSQVDLWLTENTQVDLADFSLVFASPYEIIIDDLTGQAKARVTLDANGQAALTFTALNDNQSEGEELLQIAANTVDHSESDHIVDIMISDALITPSLSGRIVSKDDFINTFGYEAYQSTFWNDTYFYDSSNPNGFYIDEIDSNGDGYDNELYRVNIATGERTLISQAISDAGWDSYYVTDTSQDGQYVVIDAYNSSISDPLLDNYIYSAVYLWSANGNTQWLSENMTWANSYLSSISDDGRYVVFDGQSIDGYTQNSYLFDAASGQLKVIDIGSYTYNSIISNNGNFIYGIKQTSDYLSDMGIGTQSWSLNQYNTATGETISVGSWTSDSYLSFWIEDTSASGRYLLIDTDYSFSSQDNDANYDSYVYDTVSNHWFLVSQTVDGQALAGHDWGSKISDDGRYVEFYSESSVITESFIADGLDWWWTA